MNAWYNFCVNFITVSFCITSIAVMVLGIKETVVGLVRFIKGTEY